MTAGGVTHAAVTLENAGSLPWPHLGADAISLSYHWQTRGGARARIGFEGMRTPLPADVPPGGRITIMASVRAPAEPGPYLLRWDLVREKVLWFSERGGTTGDQTVDVRPGTAPAGATPRLAAADLEDFLTPRSPSRTALWRAALRLWMRHPLLGVGPDNFRRLYPDVLEPGPGGRRFQDDRLHANNLYFETLADLGIIGLAALGLVMFALARAVRVGVGHADGGGDTTAAAALLGLAWGIGAATFFVHGLLDYFLEFTPTYALFWLLAGLLTALGSNQDGNPGRVPIPSRDGLRRGTSLRPTRLENGNPQRVPIPSERRN